MTIDAYMFTHPTRLAAFFNAGRSVFRSRRRAIPLCGPQSRESLHVVRQISQADLTSRSGPSYCSDKRPTSRQLVLDAEHVLDSHPRFAFLAVALFLFRRERAASRPLLDQLRREAEQPERRFRLLRDIGRVRVDILIRVAVVEQLLEHLAVVDRRVGHLVVADELMFSIDVDVVLVSEVRHLVLFRPTGVRVFLYSLVRTPVFRRLAAFDLLVFLSRVALTRNLNEACVNNLALFRGETVRGNMLFKKIEQPAIKLGFGQGLFEKPDRFRVGHAVAEREAEESHERHTVEDLIFRLIVGQVVQRFEDRYFEHQDGVVGRSSRLALLLGRSDLFEQRSKHLPIDDFLKPDERIARILKPLGSELPVEESVFRRHIAVLEVKSKPFCLSKQALYHNSPCKYTYV